MELTDRLLRTVVESVIRELDDDALTTLRNCGIKGTPCDECGCPVANYVRHRLETLYDTATTGYTVQVAVYFDQVEVNIYAPSGWWDGVTIIDGHEDMGAIAFARRFDERAKNATSPYAALVG